MKLRIWAWSSLLLVAGCGGGGGSSGAGSDARTDANAAIRFEPASIQESVYTGAQKKFHVRGVPQQDFDGDVYIKLTDRGGVVEPDVAIEFDSDDSFTAIATLRPDLTLGHHTGNFDIRLCRDPHCTSQYPGSPLALPYDVEVESHTNLSTLTPWSGVADWTTYQGNSGHSGYVPVSLDPAKFSPRWLWRPSDIRKAIVSSPVSSNGRVYITVGDNSKMPSGERLVALNESDGVVAWTHDFRGTGLVQNPAISGDRVYVAGAVDNGNALCAFAAFAGTQVFCSPMSSQYPDRIGPTVADGKVYAAGGGVYRYDAATGAQDWFAQLRGFNGWSPTAGNGKIYAPNGPTSVPEGNTGQTRITSDGQVVGFTEDQRQQNQNALMQQSSSIYYNNGSLALAQDGTLLSTNGVSLTRFAAEGGILWQMVGPYVGNPAVAGTTLFVLKGNTLEARSLTDGSLLWSWTPVGQPKGAYGDAVIATDNLVFTSFDDRVYAVDRFSQQAVWSYPMAGSLALSASGVLYITRHEFDGTPNGSLAAINLH